ncbi:uncharacterized protein EAF02_007720 [Botrytis sinoallii]|uniref:uncharacterized protein n=1 Tax=Botrytis sinoallii TaxID=1463999 RepID=UPI0018FF4BB8|nr:uncharacterized protein EAF02_007720 [Botrytis sinoallii]KAF7880083.1 hypothetical protein EAF02_007720 [Botrytis sinoallii]
MDNIMNRPERFSEANQDKGLGEILTPSEYLNRGIKVIRAIEDAINTTPHSIERLCFGAMRNILTDPKHPIDFEGYHWSEVNFHSKGYTNRGFDAVWPGFNCVCNVWVSAKVGTVIVQTSATATDLDIPGLDTPRLYNSELIYQAWRDAVTANVTGSSPQVVSKLTDLKYIIRAPIGNSGTLATMRDVLLSQGVSKGQIESEVTVKRTFDDPSSTEDTCLEQIHTIFGAMIFELGEEKASTELEREKSAPSQGKSTTTHAPSQKPQPPQLPPAAPAKVTRRISERVKNLMKKFEE